MLMAGVPQNGFIVKGERVYFLFSHFVKAVKSFMRVALLPLSQNFRRRFPDIFLVHF